MPKEGPPNIKVVWGRGDKSFCEVIRNNKKQVAYVEAPPGQQLPDAAFREIFFIVMGLANTHPNDIYQFTRYDQASIVPINQNNCDFSRKRRKKTIYIEGNVFTYEGPKL